MDTPYHKLRTLAKQKRKCQCCWRRASNNSEMTNLESHEIIMEELKQLEATLNVKLIRTHAQMEELLTKARKFKIEKKDPDRARGILEQYIALRHVYQQRVRHHTNIHLMIQRLEENVSLQEIAKMFSKVNTTLSIQQEQLDIHALREMMENLVVKTEEAQEIGNVLAVNNNNNDVDSLLEQLDQEDALNLIEDLPSVPSVKHNFENISENEEPAS